MILKEGESVEVKGSGSAKYTLKLTGGIHSCSCPAWRNVGGPLDKRTCKHLKKYLGEDSENARIGLNPNSPKEPKTKAAVVKDTAPPLLLAHTWDPSIDVTGWYVSEKLDGVRAYWDGTKFTSRLGNTQHAPDWFIKDLPKVPLDGELWLGRGRFQEASGIARTIDKSDRWRDMRYLVFDAPALNEPFEKRVVYYDKLLSEIDHPYAKPVAHKKCQSMDWLKEELARVEALQGEGLMVREPGSAYEAGRSHTLLKVKSFQDHECRVIGYEPGKGKHKNRVGALLCETPEGIKFGVGTGLTDKERENPPAIGSTITYRCMGVSDAKVPRFPAYIRVYEPF